MGSKALKTIYGQSLRRFDEFISVSQAAKLYATSIFGQSSIVLPNVVDARKFKMSPAKSDKPRIVFLGRLVQRKGAKELVAAAAYLVGSLNYKNFELIIAGDGPEYASLSRQIKSNNLSNWVQLVGRVNDADKAKLLASADIACFPSLYGESFGIVLIEAMTAGSGVVIGGNNEGYRSVLESEPLTLVEVRLRKPEILAERLKLFLTDKKLAEQIHHDQKKLAEQYDVTVVGPKLEMLYRQAIAKRHASGHN